MKLEITVRISLFHSQPLNTKKIYFTYGLERHKYDCNDSGYFLSSQ